MRYRLQNETSLVERSGILYIYYANKFKHWKRRWLHLQDQQLAIYQDSHYKRLENTINIRNYRVSITSPTDSISHKGYTFKIYEPNKPNIKPIYLSAESKQLMTQWINALRLSASMANDLLVESNFATDLHPIDTDNESDYNASMNIDRSRSPNRSYKPVMPVAATTTTTATTTNLNDQNRFVCSRDEEENIEDNRWYRPRSSSPPYPPMNTNNGVIHQPSSTTMNSWGFEVNRSANGLTSSFTSNTNTNNTDHRKIIRTPRRLDDSMEDFNERLVNRSSPPPPPQRFKLRTPTLTRHRDSNDVTVVDRLVLGPSRVVQSDYYPSDEVSGQQYVPPTTTRSRQSSTRSILRRRSKSIGDFTAPITSTSPTPLPNITQSYQPYQYYERSRTSPGPNQRTYTEHELLAWQNRMLERDQRVGSSLITRPPSTNTGWVQSPRMSSKRGGLNTSQSPNRQMPVSTRPISSMSNMSNNQRYEYEYHEPTAKLSKVIRRYMELLYHIKAFYDRISDQLFGGNVFLRNNLSTQQSVYMHHCRKIADQLQRCKPIWDRKLIDLQHLLKEVSSYEWSVAKSETTFLQRRSTLINSIQILNSRKDIGDTELSILNDIDRVLHEDKLAIQLQDELSTLLQHQSLLHDFTALLQWNRQIYSTNEQNRVENVLPQLREQITTTDGYVSNVSQHLTELVSNLRSLEKYILSHMNTIPLFDDGMTTPSNRHNWRPYNETDVDAMKSRYQFDRTKDDYQRSPRYQSRPLSMHTSSNQQYHPSNSPSIRNLNYTNENYERRRRSPSPIKTRSISASRYTDLSESIRDPLVDNFDHEKNRTSTRWTSTTRSNNYLNTNNSNNNNITTTTRLATVKPVRRENGVIPNSILKPYPHIRATTETRKDFDIDTIDKEIYKPDKVDIPDRLIDFDNDDQMLTPNERLAKLKKKEEVRKMLSKQSISDVNELDLNDGDGHSIYIQRRLEKEREKALNLQSALAEEAKEKSRQVAAKHYLNKSYQQQYIPRRNS